MKEIKKFKYLKDFKVGSSSSGPQSEGVKGKYELSTWDHWFKIDKDKFWGKIGPEETNNLIENYKEYVKCLKQSGHNSFRLSFQWTRVYKDVENEELYTLF